MDEALAEAKRLGFAEADPTDDVSGADAAAKMAILATVAFGSRVGLADVAFRGIDSVRPEHVAAARAHEMVVRLVGSAALVEGAVDVRVEPALVDRHHPLAAVEGAFNAVVLEGDAIRDEFTTDALHLSEAGYQAWLDELRPALERLREEPPMSRPIGIVSSDYSID